MTLTASMRPRGQTPRMLQDHRVGVVDARSFNEAAGADPADACELWLCPSLRVPVVLQ